MNASEVFCERWEGEPVIKNESVKLHRAFQWEQQHSLEGFGVWEGSVALQCVLILGMEMK